MPTPRPGERHDPFIDRCIPEVIADGTAQDGAQAVAVCESIWEQSRASAQASALLLILATTLVHRRLQGPENLAGELLNIMDDGAAAASTDPGLATFTGTFDRTNPRAVAIAQAQAGQLIVEVSSSSRREISSLVAQALETGIAPRALAPQLATMVTLTSTQQQAAVNLAAELRNASPGDLITRFPPRPGVRTIPGFRARVPPSGPTPAWVSRNLARYDRQQLNLRARTIARSSSHRSANAGQRELWMQAQDKGQLRRDTERVWISAGDNRVRPEHAGVDGETTGIEEEFSIGVEPGEPANCRCGQAIAPREGVGARTSV